MQQRRSPTDCKNYPLCENLKALVKEIPPDLFITKTIVLQKEAESVCSVCNDFEPKDMVDET